MTCYLYGTKIKLFFISKHYFQYFFFQLLNMSVGQLVLSKILTVVNIRFDDGIRSFMGTNKPILLDS